MLHCHVPGTDECSIAKTLIDAQSHQRRLDRYSHLANLTPDFKGHTEGLEPKVTEKIIEFAISAKGGKIATGSWTPPPPPPPLRRPFG